MLCIRKMGVVMHAFSFRAWTLFLSAFNILISRLRKYGVPQGFSLKHGGREVTEPRWGSDLLRSEGMVSGL